MLEQKRRHGGDGSQPGFSGQAVWSACPGHIWPGPSPCPLLALWTPAVLGIGSASCQGGNGQGVQLRIQSLAKKLLSESSFPWPLSTEPVVILSTSCLRRQSQSLSEHLQRRKVTHGASLTRLTSESQRGSPTTWSLPYTLITLPCPNFPFQGFSSVGRNVGRGETEKFFTTSARFSYEIMDFIWRIIPKGGYTSD